MAATPGCSPAPIPASPAAPGISTPSLSIPKIPTSSTCPTSRSTAPSDGGKTIEIVRGAPGGDDYHQIWVDPKDSDHLVLGVDQGASVSLDRGRTWTTWYNQPTAQLYHVTTDHKFPYTIYGAQQDSGAIAVHSRSNHGHSTRATGSCQAAAKAATSPSIPKTKTSSTSPKPTVASIAPICALHSVRTSRRGRSAASEQKSTSAAIAIPGRRCSSFLPPTKPRSTSAPST